MGGAARNACKKVRDGNWEEKAAKNKECIIKLGITAGKWNLITERNSEKWCTKGNLRISSQKGIQNWGIYTPNLLSHGLRVTRAGKVLIFWHFQPVICE